MTKFRIVFSTILLTLLSIAVFGQDSTAVNEPAFSFGSIWEALKKPETISIVLGLVGVLSFVVYRAGKVRTALNVIIDAAQDNRITEDEFQAIVKAVKEIFGKKKE